MNKIKTALASIFAAVFIIFIMSSCGGSDKKDKNSSDSSKTLKKDSVENAIKAGTIDDAKKLVGKFMEKGVDYDKLTISLKPTIEDAKALFTKEGDAKKAFNYVAKAFDQIEKAKEYIQPKADQNDYILLSATLKEIKEGKGDGVEFQGGYKKVIQKFKDDVVLYIFKFVKKGETQGMTYHGLTYVNNHWVILFKVWKAFK